jgi:uncharacterized membrane protein YvbJ
MFCLYCGNNLPDGAVFCNTCGRRQNLSDEQVLTIRLSRIIQENICISRLIIISMEITTPHHMGQNMRGGFLAQS